MRKLLPYLIFCGALGAQTITLTQPDCVIFFGFTASGQSSPLSPQAGFDNRQVGCTTWNLSYSISGFSSITIALQGAPNNAGSPGTWATFPNQTILSGSNPNTITAAGAFVWLYGYNPWVRVRLTAATGSGIVNGAAFGYRIPSASASPAAASNVNVQEWGGTATTLGQKTMANSVPTTIASDQSPLPTNVTQYGGAATTLGQKAASASQPVVLASDQPLVAFTDPCSPGANGAAQASFNLSASGNTRIVTGTAAKQIRVCHVAFQTGVPEDIKFVQGSKVTTDCDTTPADLSGLFKSTYGMALDPLGSFTVGSGLDLCLNQSGTQPLGGLITYMVF